MYLPCNHIVASVHPGYLAQVIKKNYLRSVERGSKSQVQRWSSLIRWRTNQFRGTIQTGKFIPWFTTGFILTIQTMAKWGFLNHQRSLTQRLEIPKNSRFTKVTNWITSMTRWWQLKYCFKKKFTPARKLEKVSNFTHIFQMGWFNHQLDEDLFGSWDMSWKDGFQC